MLGQVYTYGYGDLAYSLTTSVSILFFPAEGDDISDALRYTNRATPTHTHASGADKTVYLSRETLGRYVRERGSVWEFR